MLRIPGKSDSFREILENHPGIAAIILYEFLKIISGRIRNANSLVRENSALIQELKRQVYGDKLTGLYNKTFLEETLPGFMKNRSIGHGQRGKVQRLRPLHQAVEATGPIEQ